MRRPPAALDEFVPVVLRDLDVVGDPGAGVELLPVRPLLVLVREFDVTVDRPEVTRVLVALVVVHAPHRVGREDVVADADQLGLFRVVREGVAISERDLSIRVHPWMHFTPRVVDFVDVHARPLLVHEALAGLDAAAALCSRVDGPAFERLPNAPDHPRRVEKGEHACLCRAVRTPRIPDAGLQDPVVFVFHHSPLRSWLAQFFSRNEKNSANQDHQNYHIFALLSILLG